MTIEPVIRELCEDDIEQVIAIWHSSGIVRPWNDPMRDIALARRDLHSTILIATLSDRVAATVMVGEDGHRGWVYYVAVDPEYQGHGIGRAVMAAAENWLARRGIWKLNLLVRGDNARARDFYEHLGYRDTRSTCFQKSLEKLPD